MRHVIEFNFIRAFSALGIVVYHYSCHVNYRGFLPLFNYANDGWGNLLVTIFFMLSGLLLYLNHPKIDSLKEFYFKRWKSIFPTFYLAYGYFFIIKIIQHDKVFFLKSKITFLLSILGLDGYFSYMLKTFYILGEWFLGAIIILYLLYPLILKLIDNYEIQTLAVMSLVFLVLPFIYIFEIDPFRNILSCLFSFYFGMVAGKRKLYYSKTVLWVASATFLVIYVVPLPSYFHWIASHVTGMALFFVLFRLGHYVMNVRYLSNAVNEIPVSHMRFFCCSILLFYGF